MLALVELAGKRRGWLVALFAACAFESRFSMALALPVYAYLLSYHPQPVAGQTDEARGCRSPPCWWASARSGLLYNFARWGTWNDIGYTAWYHQDQAGMPTGSPFRFEYLPYQFWSFFVQTPTQLPELSRAAPRVLGRRAHLDVARARARVLRAHIRCAG